MAVLGVDIGHTGGVAILTEAGELIDVMDMPCLADGPKGRPAVNAALLAQIVAMAGAKDAARSEAIRRWPAKAALFSRIRDDGRAEAALIGLAGIMKERRIAA